MARGVGGAQQCTECKKTTGSVVMYGNKRLCRTCEASLSMEEKLKGAIPVAPDPEEAVETSQEATRASEEVQDQRSQETGSRQCIGPDLSRAIRILEEKVQKYSAAIQILEAIRREVS